MIREELEKKLIKRFGRTLTDQERRVSFMMTQEGGPEELRSAGYWLAERQAFPWLKTILAAAAVDAALSALPPKADMFIREAVRTSAIQASQVQVDVLIKNITDSQKDAISEALDKWYAGEVDLQGFQDLIATEFSPERAIRIGITEATRVSTYGQMEAARDLQEQGFDVHYIFHQRSDYEGCGCDELDGQEVGIDEYDKHPPIHVNCNCELELVATPPGDVAGVTIDQLYEMFAGKVAGLEERLAALEGK